MKLTNYHAPLVLFNIFSLLFFGQVSTGFSDYVHGVTSWFSFENTNENEVLSGEYTPKIPYEVNILDEKFISEAAKLTGVALSELDSCQQRVVLKLKTDCHVMNDEQLAKMAVHLLNCQSYVEGRPIFTCTDDMSIKDCTTKMDSDTWTTYHVMSNRARAVCYSIRQVQFRGLAEHTVNRLMDAAQSQLRTLNKISENQDDLHNLAENTLNTLSQGHNILSEQQKDLRRAQFHGQLALEDNIRKLAQEKDMIIETHNYLVQMTKKIQSKLEHSQNQLETQVVESQLNHNELIDDLIKIQDKAHSIFERIEESSNLLLKQNEDFKLQYEETLRNLAEVNKTVHNLVNLVGGTRQALEERLNWLTAALGGTDLALERLYLILWHSAFMLLSMLTCAFLSARLSTRLVVATLPPLNLAVALWVDADHLEFFGLTIALLALIFVQTVLFSVLSWTRGARKESSAAAQLQIKEVSQSEKVDVGEQATTEKMSSTAGYDGWKSNYEGGEVEDDFSSNGFGSPTPPLSRSGYYRARSRSNTPSISLNSSMRSACHATTRVGTRCKLTSLPGRDYCYRHQSGDSVMG